MRKFTLLVNGKDEDTGSYEYFPYADQSILDFKNTYRTIVLMKKNGDAPKKDQYIYAKYAIGAEKTNMLAVEAAYNAFQKFRYIAVSTRRKILRDIHKNLLANKAELLDLFVVEGHPRKLAEWEFLGMEKAYRKESVDFFKDELWREVYKHGNENAYLLRKPDGVVCVSPPKNAPCSNSLTAAFALLSGNTIVVKPPLKMPLATIFLWKEIVWKACKDNGAPDGTINIILGNSKQITDEWLSSPFVSDILFFGPSDAGLELGKQIYSAGKKPILELSGNDFMYVWKDADISMAVDALSDAFLGSQQICMVPKTALIHKAVFEKFSDKFLDVVKTMKVGLPSDSETCLTPVMKINEFYEFLDDAKSKGAKVLIGGNRIDYVGRDDKNGSFISPTVLSVANVSDAFKMRCVIEENFFPLLPLVCVSGDDDRQIYYNMINLNKKNMYGLRASIWAKNSSYIRKFMRDIDNCGLMRINSRHVGFSDRLSTHGGIGKTGGPNGEMNYVWQKTSHLQGISLIREKISA